MASRDIAVHSDLTLLVPNALAIILLEQKTSNLSTARCLCLCITVLIDMPNITVKKCTVLNPVTLLLAPENCVSVLQQQCSPCLDLRETPLDNSVLFVDGSAFCDPARGEIRLVILYVLHTTFLSRFTAISLLFTGS